MQISSETTDASDTAQCEVTSLKTLQCRGEAE